MKTNEQYKLDPKRLVPTQPKGLTTEQIQKFIELCGYSPMRIHHIKQGPLRRLSMIPAFIAVIITAFAGTVFVLVTILPFGNSPKDWWWYKILQPILDYMWYTKF